MRRLARFEATPSRLSAVRTVSSLTRSAVMPCSRATSAARSSVQTLVSLPKARGPRCSSARSRSAPAASSLAWIVCGRFDRRTRHAAGPARSKACTALRTVCWSQPSRSAMRGTGSPRALASTAWHRRRTNPSAERNPASRCPRSASVSGRTYNGGRMPPPPHVPGQNLPSGLGKH